MVFVFLLGVFFNGTPKNHFADYDAAIVYATAFGDDVGTIPIATPYRPAPAGHATNVVTVIAPATDADCNTPAGVIYAVPAATGDEPVFTPNTAIPPGKLSC